MKATPALDALITRSANRAFAKIATGASAREAALRTIRKTASGSPVQRFVRQALLKRAGREDKLLEHMQDKGDMSKSRAVATAKSRGWVKQDGKHLELTSKGEKPRANVDKPESAEKKSYAKRAARSDVAVPEGLTGEELRSYLSNLYGNVPAPSTMPGTNLQGSGDIAKATSQNTANYIDDTVSNALTSGAMGAAGLPGLVGAGLGAGYGAMAPGEDEEGEQRSRALQALKYGLLGGGLGAGAGLLGAGGGVAGTAASLGNSLSQLGMGKQSAQEFGSMMAKQAVDHPRHQVSPGLIPPTAVPGPDSATPPPGPTEPRLLLPLPQPEVAAARAKGDQNVTPPQVNPVLPDRRTSPHDEATMSSPNPPDSVEYSPEVGDNLLGRQSGPHAAPDPDLYAADPEADDLYERTVSYSPDSPGLMSQIGGYGQPVADLLGLGEQYGSLSPLAQAGLTTGIPAAGLLGAYGLYDYLSGDDEDKERQRR